MSFFIEKEDVLDVECYIGSVNGITVCTGSEKEMKAKGVTEYEKTHFKFKRPNFRDQSEIMDASIAYEVTGEARFQLSLMKMNRLLYLLQEWSLKDSEGKPVEVKEETIEKLDPIIGSYLSGHLDVYLDSF
jgi:hypothetical protein